MNKFVILNEEGYRKSYQFKSYNLDKKEECIVVEFFSNNFSVAYELHTDTRFATIDSIEEYLIILLEEIKTNEYVLVISEDLTRFYIKIGYESDVDIKMGQFTASKIR